MGIANVSLCLSAAPTQAGRTSTNYTRQLSTASSKTRRQERALKARRTLAESNKSKCRIARLDPARFTSQKDKRTDIEIILDMLAKESYLVNLPETNPIFWPHELSRMSPNDREKLNVYRRNFNLPMI